MNWFRLRKVNKSDGGAFGFLYPNREQLLILKTRPMCWLAIGFLVIISSFLLGRSYREPAFESDRQVLLEGRIVQKEYKESDYGGYWQLTLKQVKTFQGEYGEPAKKGKKDAGFKKESADKGNKAAHVPIESLEGRYLCQISATKNADFKIGQLVLVEGRYQSFERPTNPGQFDAKKYYGSLGILGQFKKCKILKQGTSFSKLLEGLWRLRARTQEFLKQQLGEEKGALISAMLLGEKSGLSREDKNLYRRNGISHILAISGVNTLNLVSLSKSQMPNLRASPQVLLRKFTLFYQQILSGFYPLVVLPLFRGCFSKLTKWQKEYLFAKV